MKKLIIAVLTIGLLAGCTNKKDAERALHSQGFTDVRVTGYDFFACSQDDTFHTGFVAKNPQGKIVTGTVCSGLFFKNATIRF